MRIVATTHSGAVRMKVVGSIATACVVVAAIAASNAETSAAGTGETPAKASGTSTRQTAMTSASHSAVGKLGPGEAAAPFKVTNPDGSTSFAGVGAIAWPAAQDAQPSVSQQQVIATLETTNAAPQGLEGLAPSSIRLVEYENVLGANSVNGSETPSVPKQLAWFAEYDNVKHAISLPGGVRGAGTSAVTSNPWIAVVVVSATTGTVLDAFDYSQ